MITPLRISKTPVTKDTINRKIKSLMLNPSFTVLIVINSDYKNSNVYIACYYCYHNCGSLKSLSDKNCLKCSHSKPTKYPNVTLKTNIKDIHREKAPSSKTLAPRKSTHMGVWAVSTLNQLFIRGS